VIASLPEPKVVPLFTYDVLPQARTNAEELWFRFRQFSTQAGVSDWLRPVIAPIGVAVRVVEMIVRVEDAHNGKVGLRTDRRIRFRCASGNRGIDD
jgi:hypothetical protein